jgi:predicted RNA-binding Zn-ribbon protein involved in translation (DUF1610 family)
MLEPAAIRAVYFQMKCPNCDGPLVAGEAFFRKSATDFVAFGLGSEDLRMKTDAGEEFLLLAAAEKTAAQFCPECGVAVIATEKGRRPAVRKR